MMSVASIIVATDQISLVAIVKITHITTVFVYSSEEKGDSEEEYIRRKPTWVDKLHKKKKRRTNNNADDIFAKLGSFTSFTKLLMVK
jgi:hypothetical protein